MNNINITVGKVYKESVPSWHRYRYTKVITITKVYMNMSGNILVDFKGIDVGPNPINPKEHDCTLNLANAWETDNREIKPNELQINNLEDCFDSNGNFVVKGYDPYMYDVNKYTDNALILHDYLFNDDSVKRTDAEIVSLLQKHPEYTMDSDARIYYYASMCETATHAATTFWKNIKR